MGGSSGAAGIVLYIDNYFNTKLTISTPRSVHGFFRHSLMRGTKIRVVGGEREYEAQCVVFEVGKLVGAGLETDRLLMQTILKMQLQLLFK